MLKEYPANDLLGVIKRMAYLEGVISALEDAKDNPSHMPDSRCRVERMPDFANDDKGNPDFGRIEIDFWRRKAGQYAMFFPYAQTVTSDQYVLQHAEKLATTIWKQAQEAALIQAHEDLESCRTRLKECRETLLSDEAMKDIILRDEPLQATTRSDSE